MSADGEKMDTAPEEPKAADQAQAADAKPEEPEAELSEEDMQLKKDLEGCVTRLQGDNVELYRPALEHLRETIRASTSTMTAVPKPLKFLRNHFDELKAVFEKLPAGEEKGFASDIVSLLAMTNENNARETLKFHFTGSQNQIDYWGHEYVRHLAQEIGEEFKERTQADPPVGTEDLIGLVDKIIPYYMTHNSEADACDLAMEVEQLGLLELHVDQAAFNRVCQYLLACVPFVAEPDDEALLRTCLGIFRKFSQWPQAMQMALRLNDMATITEVFMSVTEKVVRRQVAFMLARQQVWLDLEELLSDKVDDDEIEKLMLIISNSLLSQNFLALARELDILEPKTPEDIYKTHLEAAGRSSAANLETAIGNLSSTFVNAFVNAGFGRDKLLMGTEGAGGSKWIYKHKDQGMMSATAALGMLLLWDVEGGLTQIDAFMLSHEDDIKAGALLALGIVNSGVRNENEPALALLEDYTMSSNMLFRVGANMGLGLAYAGSGNETAGQLLLPVLEDSASTMEVLGVTCLGLGQIYVGTCDGEVTEAITQAIMAKTPADLASTHARFMALGLGLVFLGKQQAADVVLSTLASVPGAFGKMATTIVEICAYAGTGNVLKVQKLLRLCSEHVDTAAESYTAGDDAYQSFAVLGIGLIAMGEDVGVEMAIRSCSHLLQYGEPVIRRAVPLALAMLCVSNPKLHVLDILSKLSHDPDAATAYNSIIAMGLVGAGTNQARIAGMLRTLAQYYHKDPNVLFTIRLAQGILHTGKGSITMSPYHTDRTLMSPVAVSGLLGMLVSALDAENILLKANHFMTYHLSLAMYPRIFSTFDEDLNPISTLVRVGNAVDTVGQAGKPKTITGFVTNNTPVLLGHGERAQLATEEYISLTPILENFVLLRKNEEYEAPE